MKALPTQFDRSRRPTAVATPTCSSCCCCCCCAATIITSSAIIAQKVQHEGQLHAVPHRRIYTLIAALYLPLGLAVGLLVYWTLDAVLATCSVHTDHSYSPDYTYQSCDHPGAAPAVILGIATPIILLWLVYSRVGIARPVGRTAATVAILLGVFWAELMVGGALLLSSFDSGDPIGGYAYVALAVLVTLVVSIRYGVRLRRPNWPSADTGAPPPPPFLPAGSESPDKLSPSTSPTFLPDLSLPEKHDDSGA